AEYVRNDERGPFDVDDDIDQRAEEGAQNDDAARRDIAVETRLDEFGDRIAVRHEPSDVLDEGDDRDDGEAVRHGEPEQAGEAEGIGLRGRHHHRHGPGPDRNQAGDAEAEADLAIGDDEVLGVPHQFDFDIHDQRQQRRAEEYLQGDAADRP